MGITHAQHCGHIGAAVAQLVEQSSMNYRLRGSIPYPSRLHVEVFLIKTAKPSSSAVMYCLAAVQQFPQGHQ